MEGTSIYFKHPCTDPEGKRKRMIVLCGGILSPIQGCGGGTFRPFSINYTQWLRRYKGWINLLEKEK